MPKAAKIYANGIILAGCAAMVVALWRWAPAHLGPLALYLAVTLIASAVKIRLPGLPGTHSPCALFILFGVAHFNPSEVMLAALGSALVGTLWNTKKRPTVLQVAFNAANVCLSVGACCLVANMAFHRATSRPDVMALLAALYFFVNTIIVSGILSMLQEKRLAAVWETWYLDWFPYYIAGAALVGLLGNGWRHLDGQSWLVLPPLIYLIHFYAGLTLNHNKSEAPGEERKVRRTPSLAWVYLGAVIAAGGLLLGSALFYWHTDNVERFLAYLTATIVLATWKVRLPGLNGAFSVNFVMGLVAILELSFSEAVLIAAAGTLVQCIWKPEFRPKLVQVLFNICCLMIGSSLAYFVCRSWLQDATGQSLAFAAVLATATLYTADSVMVAGVLHLAEQQPLRAILRSCLYWTFPFFLVGTVCSGLVVLTEKTVGWQSSLLVLPVMAMAYVSYRLHLRRAVNHPAGPATA